MSEIQELARELRRRCNTRWPVVCQSAWYDACNELEKLAAASHVPQAPTSSFAKGRLFQFNRMKKERPIDPTYWDMHEERELREATSSYVAAESQAPTPLNAHQFEVLWSAVSKLESQIARNPELPVYYTEVATEAFSILRSIQPAQAPSPAQAPTPELELEQETDGRWIAEFTRFPGVMAYGTTEQEAIVNAAKVLVESQAPIPAQGEGQPLDALISICRAVYKDYAESNSTESLPGFGGKTFYENIMWAEAARSGREPEPTTPTDDLLIEGITAIGAIADLADEAFTQEELDSLRTWQTKVIAVISHRHPERWWAKKAVGAGAEPQGACVKCGLPKPIAYCDCGNSVEASSLRQQVEEAKRDNESLRRGWTPDEKGIIWQNGLGYQTVFSANQSRRKSEQRVSELEAEVEGLRRKLEAAQSKLLGLALEKKEGQ